LSQRYGVDDGPKPTRAEMTAFTKGLFSDDLKLASWVRFKAPAGGEARGEIRLYESDPEPFIYWIDDGLVIAQLSSGEGQTEVFAFELKGAALRLKYGSVPRVSSK